MVRMIALDLDGTLLEPSGKICTQTLQTLGSIHRKGIVIAIATGRPFARTLAPLEDNALYPDNPYPDILICEERDVYEWHNGRYRAWKENEKALSEEVQWLSFGHQVLVKLEEIAPDLEFALNNHFSQRSRGFVELYFVSQSEAERAFTVLTDLTRQSPLKVIRNRRNICLRVRSVGKGESLKKVAASFSFSLDDVLAIGDSHNDLEMLSCGVRAATTQNADKLVKETVIGSNGVISSAECSQGVGEILRSIG